MMKQLLYGTIASLALSCASDPQPQIATQPIVGGVEAEPEDFRAVVALVVPTGIEQFFAFCTGTLIDSKYILTAAHCVEGSKPEEMKVLFGTSDSRESINRDKAEKIVEVEEVYSHPSFNISRLLDGRDIALLRLKEPIPSTAEDPENGVDPIPYNTDLLTAHIGRSFTAIGFGLADPADGSTGGTKRFVDLSLDDVEGELTFYGNFDTNVCFGDSGGPDVMEIDGELRVISVHSGVFGPSCHGLSFSQRTDIQNDNFLEPIITAAIPVEPAHFVADGVCEEIGGLFDPDCECVRDNICNASCELDADCPAAQAEGEGCSVEVGGGSQAPLPLLLLSTFALFFLATRRRR